MDPPKKRGKLIELPRPQDAVARIEAFVAQLIESSDLMAAALVRLRDFYLSGAHPMAADSVLAEVEIALERAARAKNGF
jgi:hypothetical protein